MSEGQSARERLKISGTGAIKIETAQDAIDFATWCHESGYLPRHVQNPKQAFTIMQRGAEMGLPPFASWRFIYQTKGGKLEIESKGALAVVQSKPTFGSYKERIEGEGDGRKGVAIACRKGSDEPIIKEFTMEDARGAGLLKRPKTREGKEYDGPWQAYIKDMLLSKARARALDICFAAELGGIPIQEEAAEIVARESMRARDVTPIRERLEGQEPRALPEGRPQGFTELLKGRDFVPAEVVQPSPPAEEPPADPIEAHVEAQVDKAAAPVEVQEPAPAEAVQPPSGPEPEPQPKATTCQHKEGNSLCSLNVVPGTDRCSKHHFEEAPPSQPEHESPFSAALRERQRRRFRDPEEDRPTGPGPLFDRDDDDDEE